MRKSTILFIAIVAIAAVSFQVNALTKREGQVLKSAGKVEYPEAVKKVIDAKCFGCHSPEGKSDKAKEALNWTTLTGLEKAPMVSKLDKVIEVLEKGEMPPQKMIERNPDAKISEADSKLLKNWAETTASDLMK
jgi:mono/diheme cytochrome c family protein